MSQGKVAVEEGLGPFRRLLEERGYSVVPLDRSGLHDCVAAVVSGLDDDLLEDQEALMDGPVISAAGLTAEEVVARLEEQLRAEGRG